MPGIAGAVGCFLGAGRLAGVVFFEEAEDGVERFETDLADPVAGDFARAADARARVLGAGVFVPERDIPAIPGMPGIPGIPACELSAVVRAIWSWPPPVTTEASSANRLSVASRMTRCRMTESDIMRE